MEHANVGGRACVIRFKARSVLFVSVDICAQYACVRVHALEAVGDIQPNLHAIIFFSSTPKPKIRHNNNIKFQLYT